MGDYQSSGDASFGDKSFVERSCAAADPFLVACAQPADGATVCPDNTEHCLFAADPAIALVGAYAAALVKVSAHVGEQDEPG